MRQASQASINPRSSPQGAIKRPHGPILPNWPRRAAQSRRDLRSRHPQTTPTAFLHGLGQKRTNRRWLKSKFVRCHSNSGQNVAVPLMFAMCHKQTLHARF